MDVVISVEEELKRCRGGSDIRGGGSDIHGVDSGYDEEAIPPQGRQWLSVCLLSMRMY